MSILARLQRYNQFARDYAEKRAREIEDVDADIPADAEPVYTCCGCSYPVLARFATVEVVAGRPERHACPRCVRRGELNDAA